MKRKIVSVLCLLAIAVSAGCSRVPAEKDINSYVGEGIIMTAQLLFDGNEALVNNVFVYSHLPIDKNDTVTQNGKTYAAVKSDSYSSYANIVSTVNAVYTTEESEKILKEYDFYADINGKLYFDLSKDFEASDGVDFDSLNAKPVSSENGEYIFSVPCKAGKKKSATEMKVVSANGDWRLNEMYVK